MFKKNKISFNLLAGYGYVGLVVSSLTLVLLASAIFWIPYLNSEEAAATDDARAPSAQAVTPTVSIALQDRIDLDITPTAVGTTSSVSATLTVATTESAGYSIYLSAADNNLRSSDPANTSVIAPVEIGGVGTTLESMTANTWGYALEEETPNANTQYQGVPTDASTPIAVKDTSSTNSANDTYNLAIGANIDSSLISGTYTGIMLVSVVANPRLVTLSDIDYMQEMTTEICTNSTENETKQLIDIRDGNSYWVSKLKDNNCWMVQNLALDLSSDTPLTSDTSDVTTSWTPGQNTQTSAAVGSTDLAETYSWNLGRYVLTTPTARTDCGISGIYDLSQCTSAGFVDVSNMTAMTEERTDGVIVEGDTYDAHYLVGNYYQWNAATAGTGSSVASTGTATDSVCPKGWHLPTTKTKSDTNSGSAYYLLSQYGVNTSTSGTGIDGETYNVELAPLYFVRGGYVYSEGTTLYGAGWDANYWSAIGANSTDARFLHIIGTSVGSAITSGRTSGSSVRCLADGN